MSAVPSYSVVVPTRGDDAAMKRIIGNIVAALPDLSVLVVVNSNEPVLANHPIDSTLSPLLTYYGCTGGGVARARNLALRMAWTDHLVFLDDDVVPSQTAVAQLCTVLEDTETAVVTGRVVPSTTDGPAHAVYQDFYSLDRGPDGTTFTSADAASSPFTAWLLGVGAAFAVDRAALGRVPSPPVFDESLSNGRCCGGAEDVDFFLQCLASGLTLTYCPAAVFEHRYSPSITVLRRKVSQYSRADGAFYAKWRAAISYRDLAGDLRAWARRLATHTSLTVAGQPHIPLRPLLFEPVDKLWGALWWTCCAGR